MAVRGAFWILVYLAVAVAPLIFAWSGPEPGRGLLIDLSVALGFVGLAMMGLQFALVARFKSVSAPFGMDVVLQYHRQMAYVALLFILAHPVLLFVEDTQFLALLNPATAPLRAHMAVTSTVALLILVALSVWRRKLKISYEMWQLTHGVLGVMIIATALAHVFLVGYYVDEPWEKALWLAMSAGFVFLLFWVRVVRPLQRYRSPWRVEEIISERGETSTIVLKQQNGNGFAFEPGQFAWILAGKSPFAITQHPFSISSSAEQPDRVTLSVKSAGDFTSSIAALRPGGTVYLDGPHGAFTIDRHEGPGFVFIGAGVGVTPLMSMLRTLADRGDVRPCYLFLGNRNQESITFREEIETLKSRLNLKVIHVLSRPEEGWEGEKGRVEASILSRSLTGEDQRRLPPRYRRLVYFICGPDAMMDAAENSLAQLGAPAENVHSERFGMV
ncbi:MAG: ferric reductase-like transmembrane domain-containing protein [Rubrobacter sp.]|nr:ferric reductase-like transmembrane domain-containing protein [Rubrobacter sp.]